MIFYKPSRFHLRMYLIPRQAGWILWLLGCLVLGSTQINAQDAPVREIVLVVGAPGAPEYKQTFSSWANRWKQVVESETSDTKLTTIGMGQDNGESDAKVLKQVIDAVKPSVRELWVVLIGHGTDNRSTSKFNLRGPDVSASQLDQWLKRIECRTIVINCSSSSGAFLAKLKSENRILITATKNGAQRNFARFGGYLAEAIADPGLDLDKDQQTSLLEAFVAASNRTQEFYEQETRLATELAALDDNSDGLGTPADWFQGTRVVRESKKGEPDGLAANQIFLVRRGAESKLSEKQRQSRNELEFQLETLRSRKSTMEEDAYYQKLEAILLQLARIYEAVDSELSSIPSQLPKKQ